MIRAILFDKDGTLTDFRATWDGWMPAMIRDLSRASGHPEQGVADAFGFDLGAGRLRDDALIVTAPGHVTVAAAARAIGWSARDLSAWIGPRSSSVRQVMVPGVPQVVARLVAAGLPLGVLTNASEAEARNHLTDMGIVDHITRIIGHDSGFGAKPDPRGAADFARALGLPPASVALVGDGLTDMAAARGAGLTAVAVLTGTLGRAALAPHAAAVIDDVTGLPDWLAMADRESRAT
ncbi:HAD family hydrolase [Jannaschia pohangensis]|uniref:phosphoglycolate phosphatase n=1 Tax=Jannaschia pohangensis TaxID=390807 RepID=A0A1I3SFC3_9RHOB|nr:HAD family hydrolase [Jannaschia pohangensis]SFJ57040.1 phosphoglycolate phosphatase [Jannaschia pohangensis]